MTEEYDVRITVWATARDYKAALDYEDKAGKEHQKVIQAERRASVRSNYLEALIQAFNSLRVPCLVTVYMECGHIVAAFEHGWVQDWQRHSWKNKKGHAVRNQEQWQRLKTAMRPHSARFIQVRRSYGYDKSGE